MTTDHTEYRILTDYQLRMKRDLQNLVAGTDVAAVVGAGVGSPIKKESDVGYGASKAKSAIIHSGFMF
jgi:hypothetical protein